MNERNRNLILRVTSVGVLLPLVLLLVYWGGPWSTGLMALAAGICAGEYYRIVGRGLDVGSALGVAGAALLPFWAQLPPALATQWAFWTFALVFLVAWVEPLLRREVTNGPTRAAHLFTGSVYSGVGFYALSALRGRQDGLGWLIAAMTVTWSNDTLAYFFGRFFGRHKLYAEVSPNKTWEGFGGGLVGSVAGLFIARAVYVTDLTPRDCVVLGLLGGILGPLGDLCESMLKRAYGVKDSSQLIPGHGGLLDRVDALLFNGPLVYVYVHFLRHLWQR